MNAFRARPVVALALLVAGCAGELGGAEDAGGRAGMDASRTDASPMDAQVMDAQPIDAPAVDAPDARADAGPALGPDCVAQLHPTASRGAAPWYLGVGAWRDRIRQFGTVTGEDRLTTVRASGQVRFTVLAEAGSTCEGDTDQGRALARGFMCSESDWRSFEMTGYLRVITGAPAATEQDFTMYGNGGRHTGSGPPTGCLGSSYKASYDYVQGRWRFAKESWHVLYDHSPWRDLAGGPDLTAEDRFVGFKFVRYEFERGGERGVRLELWIDLGPQDAAGCPANEWTLVGTHEDHPDAESWGSRADECGAPAGDQIMLWGGPWVTWRWDDTDAELRLMSVREIDPPAPSP